MRYRVFTRNWWKHNPSWPNGKEPNPTARKHTIGFALSESEAQEMCRKYNATHNPGFLSRKAEYTEVK